MEALVKALRGGRSGSSSHPLPAIGRRVPHEGSPATPAAGMGRAIHTSEGTLIERLSKKFRHVNGRFEPADSEFVLLHMNEQLKKIEGYQRTARNHWAFPLLTLFVGLAMVRSVVSDYHALNRVEKSLQELRRELAEAQVESAALDISIHGA